MSDGITTKEYHKRLRGDDANRIAHELCQLLGLDVNRTDEIAVQVYLDNDYITVLKARYIGADTPEGAMLPAPDGWSLIKLEDDNG